MRQITYKRVIKVDWENIHCHGIEGIIKLHENDRVEIFYSKKSNKINIETCNLVMSSKASIKFVEIEQVGENSLDFQLLMSVGFDMSKDYDEIIIISKNKDFINAQAYLRTQINNSLTDILQYTSIKDYLFYNNNRKNEMTNVINNNYTKRILLKMASMLK